jgi:hypothetical protein
MTIFLAIWPVNLISDLRLIAVKRRQRAFAGASHESDMQVIL